MFRSHPIRVYLTILIICHAAAASAQPAQLPPYQPSREEMIARYTAATFRDSAIKNTVFRDFASAHWLEDGNAFWYRNVLKDSITEYLFVDAVTGAKRKAFDKEKLAAALSRKINKPVQPEKLLLSNLSFNKEATSLSFKYSKKNYRYNLKNNRLVLIDSLPVLPPYSTFAEPSSRWDSYKTDSISPDKQYEAGIKDNNVFIRSLADSSIVQYTKDGSKDYPYGSLAWSPDSKYVIGYHIKPVVDSPVYYVLSSMPGTTRGQLRSQPYKQPGDPFTTYEMFSFPVQQRQPIKVQTDTINFFDAPTLHWTKDSSHFLYEKVDRGNQRFRIIEVDPQTGSTHTVLDEQAKTFIQEERIFTHYLPETNEIIWTSEKDGWRHIYLIDAQTGAQKNEITKGEYVVRGIDSIDIVKREIWFSAGGMNAGEDPYHLHFYHIGFDGNNLVSLTQAAANHWLYFSPDRRYYLDWYTEVNQAPVTELHATLSGKKITTLETADIRDYLAVVKRLPQPFTAKGRDGVTDIWGIMCLPTEFDSTKRYPVIENIYAGPQDAYVIKWFMRYYRDMQSLADLGFIVVQIDGMGTANRSKAFHDVCWKNLADAGFPDRILWMKALAAKYSYVDTSRVGIYGMSAGGQNALGGLLFHPEFYKAGVASCGCHDNRVDKQWWNEQWMGYPVGPHYAEQSNVTNAYKLQGSLLLMVGEADTNVPPESTYRVADALIKANKTFDFLPLPGSDHTDGGIYGQMKIKDFFVQHLLGVQPPSRNRSN